MTVVILTSSPGSNQTWNVPPDWNNSNNKVEVIGGGGSGASASLSSPVGATTGGGGGAYSAQTNITLTPGGTATYQIGTGGAAVSVVNSNGSNGNAGGDTWFNGTTLAGSSVGAKGGGAGTFGTNPSGTAGGAAGSGIGATKNSGGGSGSVTDPGGTGGGGAAGSHGNGNTSSNANNSGTAGGSGDAGSGGSGGSGGGSATNGGNGTEFDASHGSGGGGGAISTNIANQTSGSGGNYGGGGGGCYVAANGGTSVSGAGIQGIIVITYTPVPAAVFAQNDFIPRKSYSLATLIPFSAFEPDGTITSKTPQGWMLESPTVLKKQYNASEQQFSTFELQGSIFSITPQGWMSQQPLFEIFIRQFPVFEQQFQAASWILPNFTSSLIVVEVPDSLLATLQMLGRTIPSTTRAYASGQDYRGNTIYWYFDAVTGLPAVDSDGNPLNPFTSR